MTGRLRVDLPRPEVWDLRVDGVVRPVGAWSAVAGERARVEVRARLPLPGGVAAGVLRCDVPVPAGGEVVVSVPLPDAVVALLPG